MILCEIKHSLQSRVHFANLIFRKCQSWQISFIQSFIHPSIPFHSIPFCSTPLHSIAFILFHFMSAHFIHFISLHCIWFHLFIHSFISFTDLLIYVFLSLSVSAICVLFLRMCAWMYGMQWNVMQQRNVMQCNER